MSTLSRAIELTEIILHAISQNDLARVSRLEKERQQLIDSYYSDTDAIDQALTLNLIQLNDDIVSQLLERQQQTRSEHVQLTQSNKASMAYRKNMHL